MNHYIHVLLLLLYYTYNCHCNLRCYNCIHINNIKNIIILFITYIIICSQIFTNKILYITHIIYIIIIPLLLFLSSHHTAHQKKITKNNVIDKKNHYFANANIHRNYERFHLTYFSQYYYFYFTYIRTHISQPSLLTSMHLYYLFCKNLFLD